MLNCTMFPDIAPNHSSSAMKYTMNITGWRHPSSSTHVLILTESFVTWPSGLLEEKKEEE